MIVSARQRLYAFLTQEHWLIGASLVRISLGIWALYYYLLHFPVRHLLWGPQGLWPFERYLASRTLFSVFQFSAAPLFFDAVYLTGIVVALLFTLGWHTRVMSLLHWVMILSLQERNFLITDGGDNLMRLVLLFLILVNCGAYFSLDALRRRAGQQWFRPALAVAHNFGVLLTVVQLCLLYASTGLYKTMGTVWQNGTALYYILRVGEFSWPGGAEIIYRNPYLVVLGTYGTILFELMFASLLLNRWTRYAVVATGVAFHLGIAVFMGLATFSWSMLSVYPLLFTDREYMGAARGLRAALQLTVLYDGWCPTCTRSVRWLKRLDLFSLAQFVSFRDPGVIERYRADPGRAERRILSIGRSGHIAEGIDTVIQIASRSVLLWPTVPVLALGRLLVGQKFYDAMADRRLVLAPGNCAGHCIMAEGLMK